MNNLPSSKPNTVLHFPDEDTNGQAIYRVSLTEAQNNDEKILYYKSKKVIPVVYMHGMLSASLKATADSPFFREGKNVWYAPGGARWGDGLAKPLFSQVLNPFYGPDDHHKRLDANYTKVDYEGGPIRTPEMCSGIRDKGRRISKEIAKTRGWGAVWVSNEQTFLDKLQYCLEALDTFVLPEKDGEELMDELVKRRMRFYNLSRRERKEQETQFTAESIWMNLLALDPKWIGGISYHAEDKVTIAELKVMQSYKFDVWVAAYNWLEAHETSGENTIYPRVNDEILGTYKDNSTEPPKKVVIVTHSLGGIASRTFTQVLGHEDLVWGVSHSCQPATGSSTAYHHVRCGYPGFAGWVLGPTSKYLLPIFANSPGLTALMPFPQYQNSQPWFFVGRQTNTKGSLVSKTEFVGYPSTSDGLDIYEEVYKNSAWYGLIPEESGKIMALPGEPEGRMRANPKTPEQEVKKIETQQDFCLRIDEIEKFQKKFHDAGYHPFTFAHAESSIKGEAPTWNHNQWLVSCDDSISFSHILQAKIQNDNYKGQLKLGLGTQTLATKFLANKVSIIWADPYSANVISEIPITKDGIAEPDKYSNLALSGDGTVGAASSEAPYIADIKGGFYFHGNEPAHEKVAQKVTGLRKEILNKKDGNGLGIPPFYEANYGHAGALKEDLPFYSILHSLVKIINLKVKDEDFG